MACTVLQGEAGFTCSQVGMCIMCAKFRMIVPLCRLGIFHCSQDHQLRSRQHWLLCLVIGHCRSRHNNQVTKLQCTVLPTY